MNIHSIFTCMFNYGYFMNEQNCKIISERIKEAAANLEGKLPASPKHPSGRNPYAHIPKVIKDVLGMSYKDVPDALFDHVIMIIEHCEQKPF